MIISDIQYIDNEKKIQFDWKNFETQETGQFIAEAQDKIDYESLENYNFEDINNYLTNRI